MTQDEKYITETIEKTFSIHNTSDPIEIQSDNDASNDERYDLETMKIELEEKISKDILSAMEYYRTPLVNKISELYSIKYKTKNEAGNEIKSENEMLKMKYDPIVYTIIKKKIRQETHDLKLELFKKHGINKVSKKK